MSKINSLVGMTDKFSGLIGGAGVKTEAFAGAPKKK
jgi:hypothetical protein